MWIKLRVIQFRINSKFKKKSNKSPCVQIWLLIGGKVIIFGMELNNI